VPLLILLGNRLALVVSLLKSFKIKPRGYPVVFKSHFTFLNLKENIMDPILLSVILAQLLSVIKTVTWPQTKTSFLWQHVLEKETENLIRKE